MNKSLLSDLIILSWKSAKNLFFKYIILFTLNLFIIYIRKLFWNFYFKNCLYRFSKPWEYKGNSLPHHRQDSSTETATISIKSMSHKRSLMKFKRPNSMLFFFTSVLILSIKYTVRFRKSNIKQQNKFRKR